MASSEIISQINVNEQLVNLRASALRYFVATDSQTPGAGEVSCVLDTDNRVTTFYIRPDLINWYSYKQQGTMFIIEVPSSYSHAERPHDLYINMGEGDVSLVIDNGNNSLSIASNEFLLIYYEIQTNKYHIIDNVKVSNSSQDIAANSVTVPTGNAVYDYVTNMISNRWKYVVCTANAANIPAGAQYINGNTTIIGSLTASASTEYKIYLVKHTHTDPSIGTNGRDAYDEWITVKDSSSNYSWEKIGNTDIDLDGIEDYILGNINDHIVPIPTSGSVYISGHRHTFTGSATTSVGTISPMGSIYISTTDTSLTQYYPTGAVSSSFSGTSKRIKFIGSDTAATLDIGTKTTSEVAGTTCPISVDESGGKHNHTGSIGTANNASDINISTLALNGGAHTHIGTIPQFNCTGTLSNAGSASSYTVDGEVLILSAGSVPSTTVNITISTKTSTTSEHSGHTHKGVISAVTLSSIAKSLKLTIDDQKLLVKLGTHSHTIAPHTAIGTIVPKGIIIATTTTSGSLNITPAGDVTSTFVGDKVYFGFKGRDTSVSVIGTPNGTIGTTTIGTKSLTLKTSISTLTHNDDSNVRPPIFDPEGRE